MMSSKCSLQAAVSLACTDGFRQGFQNRPAVLLPDGCMRQPTSLHPAHPACHDRPGLVHATQIIRVSAADIDDATSFISDAG